MFLSTASRQMLQLVPGLLSVILSTQSANSTVLPRAGIQNTSGINRKWIEFLALLTGIVTGGKGWREEAV